MKKEETVSKIVTASTDCSPLSFFEVYEWYVSFSTFFKGVGCKNPMVSSGKARHNELGLNVTLSLNVSLDLGLGLACNMT